MERHKCKLCTRTFANGRALGGHMKAHLATLPLPPKPQPFQTDESFSFSYSSSQSEQQQQQQEAEQVVLTHSPSPSPSQSLRESEEKGVIYGLRGNPKKSFRVADPEFSFAAPPPDTAGSDDVVIVQDRESETESNKNPARQRRSKRNRNRNSTVSLTPNLQKKPKLSFVAEPPAEQEPVVSSVSDASKEEDVAMCLMMLSRDTWKNNNNNNNNAAKQEQHQELEQEGQKGVVDEFKVKRVRGKKHQHECERCGKKFRSSRALGSHRSICCRGESGGGGGDGERVFECPFCSKVFGSGQALGGHKRSHLMGMNAATSSSTANNDDSVALLKSRESFIDLNLPAPVEEEKDDDDDDDDDELSVVSDA